MAATITPTIVPIIADKDFRLFPLTNKIVTTVTTAEITTVDKNGDNPLYIRGKSTKNIVIRVTARLITDLSPFIPPIMIIAAANIITKFLFIFISSPIK